METEGRRIGSEDGRSASSLEPEEIDPVGVSAAGGGRQPCRAVVPVLGAERQPGQAWGAVPGALRQPGLAAGLCLGVGR